MNDKKTSYLSVPVDLVIDKKISSKAKYLYIILKKHSYEDVVEMKYDKLMRSLMWKDKRGFKKYLVELRELGYISYNFKSVSELVALKIEMHFKKPFIQLDRNLIESVLDLYDTTKHNKEKGLLYLYYLEYMYRDEWGYACPSFRELADLIKMNNKELKEMIWLYHINYICEYTKGYMVGSLKVRNRYIVNNSVRCQYSGKFKKRYKNKLKNITETY